MSELSLLINLGGAALFALVGIVVLALSRGRPRGIWVGAAAATFGMTWVFENVARLTAFGPSQMAGLNSFSALSTVACLALAYHLVKSLARGPRTAVLVLAVVCGTAWIGFFVAGFAVFYAAFVLSLIVLVGAIGMASREAVGLSEAYACLGLAFAPFVAFLYAAFAGSAGFDVGDFGTGRDLLFLGLGATTAVAIAPFGRGRQGGGFWPRVVLPATVVCGVAGLVLVVTEAPTFSQDYGSFGIIRAVGAFFLALAVFRYDLLGVPLPRIAVRRGTLATGALALLFVVAEVAQNFLSAEFGLLMGGVIAGTLLFAANPVQRAMERLYDHGKGPQDTVVEARREEAYQNAIRLVLRDRRLTRAEERHLAALAEELGIGAHRAHELLVDAENESGVA